MQEDDYSVMFIAVVLIGCLVLQWQVLSTSHRISITPQSPTIVAINDTADLMSPSCGWDKTDSIFCGSLNTCFISHYNESNNCRLEYMQQVDNGPWVITMTADEVDRMNEGLVNEWKWEHLRNCKKDYPDYCQPMRRSVCTPDGCRAVDVV